MKPSSNQSLAYSKNFIIDDFINLRKSYERDLASQNERKNKIFNQPKLTFSDGLNLKEIEHKKKTNKEELKKQLILKENEDHTKKFNIMNNSSIEHKYNHTKSNNNTFANLNNSSDKSLAQIDKSYNKSIFYQQHNKSNYYQNPIAFMNIQDLIKKNPREKFIEIYKTSIIISKQKN